MTKAKLKTYTDLNKKIKFKASNNQEVVPKAEKILSVQMIVIAECGNLQMSEVLAHPLGPLPWTLAKLDGTLPRKTNRASLAKELQKNVQAADVIPRLSACLIDGMALVQRLKGGQKTFAEIAESLLSMALNEGTSSDKIDVAFDDCQDDSIKSAERENRGKGSRI